MPKMIQRQSGFTLLEVLIAFMVLSFGLLGAVALQAQAKRASFDSLQRSAAISLGEDIIQRIRANDMPNLVALYDQDFTSTDPLNPEDACYDNTCTPEEMAATDLDNWRAAIRARENTGALDDATVCIEITPEANTGTRGFNIDVIITWNGRQDFTATAETQSIQCGNNTSRRRLVRLQSFLLRRV